MKKYEKITTPIISAKFTHFYKKPIRRNIPKKKKFVFRLKFPI